MTQLGSGQPRVLSALLADIARPAPGAELPSAATLRPGAAVDDRFELVRPLGPGGSCAVWEARDVLLGREVAVKLLRGRRGASAARALEEAEAIAWFSHPNVAEIRHAGFAGPAPYLVLELLHGESVAAALARGPLGPARALEVAIEVARALARAHERKVLHGDLRPSSVFLTEGGGVKVLDLGLAQLLGRRDRGPEAATYVAPEQRRGRPADERTDVWALGVVLHEMVRGARPRGRGAPRGLAARLPRSKVPPELAELVERMIADEPTRRPRDGVAALAELLRVHDLASVRRVARPRARLVGPALAVLLTGLGIVAGQLLGSGATGGPSAGAGAKERAALAALPVGLAVEGRRREALEAFDALGAAACAAACAVADEVTRLHLLLTGGNVAAAREELARWEPPAGSELEEHLWLWPWLGLAEQGARRAAAVTPGTRGERRHAGAAALRRGDRDGAVRILGTLAPHDPAVEVQFLLAEALLAAGRLDDALAPLARVADAEAPGAPPWRASLRPWALLLLARTHARLGEGKPALLALARLAREWARADRDLPLLREAEALARELGTSLPGLLVASSAPPG